MYHGTANNNKTTKKKHSKIDYKLSMLSVLNRSPKGSMKLHKLLTSLPWIRNSLTASYDKLDWIWILTSMVLFCMNGSAHIWSIGANSSKPHPILLQMAVGFLKANSFGDATSIWVISLGSLVALWSRIERVMTPVNGQASLLSHSPCIMWTNIATWVPIPLFTPLRYILMQNVYPSGLVQIAGLSWATIAPVMASRRHPDGTAGNALFSTGKCRGTSALQSGLLWLRQINATCKFDKNKGS